MGPGTMADYAEFIIGRAFARPVGQSATRPSFLKAKCPSGKSIFSVQPCCEKYFAFAVGQIISRTPRHPGPQEGRWPSSRTLGRDAVDAAASGAQWSRRAVSRERATGARTNGAKA